MFLRHLELLQLNHILASTMKKYEDQMYKAQMNSAHCEVRMPHTKTDAAAVQCEPHAAPTTKVT